jgi:hypothetical protein
MVMKPAKDRGNRKNMHQLKYGPVAAGVAEPMKQATSRI